MRATAVTKDITVEIQPASTVEISVNDVDGGSFDASNTIVDMWLTYDGGAPTFSLVFDAAGVYEVTLTVQNDIGQTDSAPATVTVIDAVTPTEGDVIWTGAASTDLMDRREWMWGANWMGNEPPAIDTPGTVIFADEGLDVESIVETNRSVEGLRVASTLGTHWINLGGNTLSVTGALQTGNGGVRGTGVLFNGTLDMGPAGDLSVGYYNGGGSNTLTLEGDVTLFGPLGTLSVGRGEGSHMGTLEIMGPVSGGVLAMDSLHVGDRGTNWNHGVITWGLSSVDLAPGTVSTVKVLNNVLIGRGGGRAHGRFGEVLTPVNWGADGYGQTMTHALPVGCNLILGDQGSEMRCAVTIGRGSWYDTSGELVAASGGAFTGYISSLIVGKAEEGGEHGLRGKLLLGTMASCSLDAESVYGGGGGTVSLPAGNATVATTSVGTDMVGTGSQGGQQLDLNGTQYAVTTSLEIGARGTVNTEVGATSAGVDLASAATFSIESSGMMNITFTQDPPPAGMIWGLRWEGNRVSDVRDLVDLGRLAWDDSAVTVPAALFSEGGFTYIAQKETAGPTAVTRDITVELQPASTVEISMNDVDGGSFDAVNTIVDMSLTYNGGPPSPTLVFSAAGVYAVTLTVENDLGQTDSAPATVTVLDAVTPTHNDVIWRGAAPTDLMDRRQWMWAANWMGNKPPAVNTTGTVIFGDEGLDVDSIVEVDRSARTVSLRNSSDSHTIDLGGNTLTVTTTLEVGSGGVRGEGTLINGTIQPTHVSVGHMDASPECKLTLGADATLAGDPRTINLGRGTGARGTLDLTGAAVSDGVLSVGSLHISDTTNYTSSTMVAHVSALVFDETTSMQMLRVTDNLVIGRGGGRRHGRIGKVVTPVTDNHGQMQELTHALPVGLNLTLGDESLGDAGRCAVIVGRGGHYNTSGEVVATEGGHFEAWVSTLEVGVLNPAEHWSSWLIGRLLLGSMDSCNLNATSVVVGQGADSRYMAHMSLPPGNAEVSTTAVGVSTNSSATGTLDLVGTVYNVGSSFTVGARGTVNTNVSGTSCGLDLGFGASLTVADGGLIDIVFDETDPAGGVYYGLRAQGDRVADLQALEAAGKLTWDDTLLEGATGHTISIFKDLLYTYVGVPVTAGKLPGDVNGDCVVNILDLIGIRNHLNQDPNSPEENKAYNVNDDDAINILDMIYVRNRLNTSCPE